jgi:hypothetical protein
MPTLTLTLPRPHDAQARIIREARRFNVVNCGRRFGKTLLGINRAITPDVMGLPVGWFSPTYKDMLEVWREASATLRPIITRRNVQERRIELITGGVLEFWSLDNSDAGRGRKYARIIVDEAAKVANLLDIWHLTLRPTLADYEGGAWFLSTPRGRNGFWTMYQWGQDDGRPEWASWKMPTMSNPFIADVEIEAMRREMPDARFQQEILANFIEDFGGVFRRVQEAATATAQDEPVPGHSYVFGVDWGKQHDFTAIAVMDINTRDLVYLDRFNQIDYAVQLDRLGALYNRFSPIAIVAERNSMGDPLIEQLQRLGLPVLPFVTTNATKTMIVESLSLALEQSTLRIIDDPILIGELQAYEMQRTAAGNTKYSAPDGMHDDTVMALAIAWHGAREVYTPLPPSGILTQQEAAEISPY